jgi:hypothetical protein
MSLLYCITYAEVNKKLHLSFLISIILITIYFHYWYQKSSRPFDWHGATYQAAIWARQQTKENEVFAMKDSGNFGFFSQRHVINLDGLVNNFEYQAILKDRKLNEYLRRNKVVCLVQHAFEKEKYQTHSHWYKSHQFQVDSDPVVVKEMDEIYRSKPYYEKGIKNNLVIWRLRN